MFYSMYEGSAFQPKTQNQHCIYRGETHRHVVHLHLYRHVVTPKPQQSINRRSHNLVTLLLLFLTFSVLVAKPEKTTSYTAADPARGLLNRKKRTCMLLLLLLIRTFSVLSLPLKKLPYGDTTSQPLTYQMSIPLVVIKRFKGQRVTSW